MTKIFQWPKCLSKEWPKCFSKKKQIRISAIIFKIVINLWFI